MSFGSILYVGLSCFLIAVLLPKLSLAFLWLGASLVFVAFAYKDSNAQRLGKRRDGSFSLLSNILLFPYLFLIRVAWIQYRYTKGKVPFHPLVDNIWIGRRLLKDELPEGPAMMIDLSYEFSVDTKAYDGKVYRCLPILDCHTRITCLYGICTSQLCSLSRPKLRCCSTSSYQFPFMFCW